MIFFLSIVLLIAVLAYIKHTKNAEMAAKAGFMGKAGGPQTLFVSGFVAEYSKLNDDLSVNGNILAQDEVQLQPEASGRVVMLNIKEGNVVSKGTLLMKINDADLQAQLSKLKPQLKVAQKNLSRVTELLKINGISQADYDAAENTVTGIQADIELLNAQIAKTELRAPFNGKLGLRNISIGAYVSPNTVVASLQNIEQLKMDIAVPERYASVVKIGDDMKCTIAGVDKSFSAHVMAIEPNVDELTRNIKVRAVIQKPSSSLLPGAYVKVMLVMKNIPNAIMIPTNAVIPNDRSTKVVIADSSKAKFVPVEIGIRTDNEVQILSGLKPGDTVLTTGLLQVKPGMSVKITKTTTRTIVK